MNKGQILEAISLFIQGLKRLRKEVRNTKRGDRTFNRKGDNDQNKSKA
jgi:hypothetical protein